MKTNSVSAQGYKKLMLYQKSKELVINIYKLTDSYPASEKYGLIPQTRRASVSVLANIVEGYSKDSSKEYARFLTISIGSVTEVEVFLDISFELGFLDRDNLDRMNILVEEIKKLLYGSRKAVRSRIQNLR